MGVYPTIAEFTYGERTTFTHVGKPFLAYEQRTWALDDGRPLHAEAGYWRASPATEASVWALEVVIAHPMGLVEVEEGTASAHAATLAIELASTTVAATATAKEVTALARRLWVDSGGLRYELDMAAMGQPCQPHLSAHLMMG